MSGITDFPDDEEKALKEERSREVEKEAERPPRLQKLSFGKRLGEFWHNIKLEMRKTTWPTRNEVWSTTVVVLIAVVFFGFYLWGVDLLVALGFKSLENVIK